MGVEKEGEGEGGREGDIINTLKWCLMLFLLTRLQAAGSRRTELRWSGCIDRRNKGGKMMSWVYVSSCLANDFAARKMVYPTPTREEVSISYSCRCMYT